MNYVLRNPPLVYWHQRMVSGERLRTADTYERWCESTASSTNFGRTYSSGAAITAKK
jgi:hypothetical protein